ncbi:MAG: tRNA preQ1(34) S-adenosylmethionine ribosyltransferase-isomerase QueA [Deltaproteobacteria bacterium]|nr:MAG: tRNA preQ1(34) S-adenosylmethionine ribosyltransferase-isomerase QueA [Deltaproteobacteria bacterium]
MRKSDFNFTLPEELIAQEPVRPRDSSRLLVVDRQSGHLSDEVFSDLPSFLSAGDLLVVNDTRVVPARLWGKKESGGRVEVLLLSREGERRWTALLRAAKKFRAGMRVLLAEGASFLVEEVLGEGRYLVFLESISAPEETIEALGEMPLPPYIRRAAPRAEDHEWYQTLFAHPEKGGSSAAPTAGLHFTEEVRAALLKKGVDTTEVTLHVGLGTFLPVRVEDLSAHEMHSERYELGEEAALKINRALEEGRRVMAVGTTATRVLEHCGAGGRVLPGKGETKLFITPGYDFKVVSAMVTNFHLPESTLLMLVSALGGRELILSAYRHAVRERYRFYSYGDAMLIK